MNQSFYDSAAARYEDVATDNPLPCADAGPLGGNPDRVHVSSANLSGAAVDLTPAPASGEHARLVDLWISVDTAMRVDVKEETSGTVLLSFYLPANGSIQATPRDLLKAPAADKKIQAQTSASGNVRITCLSRSEA